MRKRVTNGTTYASIGRIIYLLESKQVHFKVYLNKFEITRSTAFRDFNFVRNYKDYSVTRIDKDTYAITGDGGFYG